jgi:hypothetical protein
MRKPIRDNPNRIPKGRTTTIPAPVKGWYAQESLIDADPQSASVLDNFFPEPETIRARRGKQPHVTGIEEAIETLMPYVSATGTQKLFAAAVDGSGARIWDVTDAATIDPDADTPAVDSLANARFQHTMFATAGGQFLYCVNGEDNPQYYNGTTWANPAITGVDESTFVHVWAHKSRLWFAAANSTTVWYLDTDSIQGEAHEFPLGNFLVEGGYIMAGSTWSVDAGDGMDNLMVVYSSEGEVLIYAGDDPTVDFALLGRYSTGDPLGRRCLFPVGGDLLLINELGLLPVSALIKIDQAATESKSLVKNIRRAYADAVHNSRDAFGWQVVSYPIRNMALLNVPADGSQETVQFAYNTITGAWSRFTNWDALCWAHFNAHPSVDNLFFGTSDGRVMIAESGGDDDGAYISCTCVPAFTMLNMPGRLKHVLACRPIVQTDIDQAPTISIAVDYEVSDTGAIANTSHASWFTWDVSVWDGDDVWRGEFVSRPWLGVGNIGTAIAPVLRIDIDATNVGNEFVYRLIGYDIIYEPGGVI